MSSKQGGNNNKKSGVDTLLTLHGKSLQVGEQLRFVLVKGPSGILQEDPVNPKAPKETFPLIAKFPESVVKPDFEAKPWDTARLYQQDTPKAQDDSDEEQDASADTMKKRKKGWRRRDAPKRQWMLQPSTEFLETMMRKRQKLPPVNMETTISARYEGYPEHNPSQYGLLSVAATATTEQNGGDVNMQDNDDGSLPKIQVQLIKPPFATQTFAQPSSRQTLSLRDAEHAIQDQRANLSRYMMHRKGMAATNGSKSRLFGKLNKNNDNGGIEDDDDVMGDVTFTNRKSGSGRARKELLSTLAEDGLKVDEDGVLGGANDSEFGGKRQFGRFAADNDAKEESNKKGEGATRDEKSTVGYDGMAMSDDFYQRDVKAEYEDLDYDANEQFDDDDVDLGEAEVVVDPNSGFQEEEDDEDEEELEESGGGAEGLATVAGFRALLAKARGETPAEASDGEDDKKDEVGGSRPVSPNRATAEVAASVEPTADDTLAQVMTAAEKLPTASKQKIATKAKTDKPSSEGVEIDEKGERLVTQEAIRREIWLHHGAIATKRLMKIFNIKKKTAQERRDKFMEAVKELCTVKSDPVQGNMLVLKQHYSSLG